jgi:NAD(P)-dependent dehydrogenase (short-subunit alcohol dehydrogenase family)
MRSWRALASNNGPMGRLDGRVAVITGGASGMGRATVLRFLAEGARVVVADLNEEHGAALLREVDGAANAGAVRFVRSDVAVEPDVERLITLAVDEFGGVDIVFNNAGVGGAFGPVTRIEVEDWDYTFAVLTRGVFLGIKHGAAAMQASGAGGSIINTASIAGLSGGAGPLAYSAAKAAVINLTQSAAVELAHDRIRVNAICPGAINTPLAAGRADPAVAAERFASLQPWPETGTGDHIAGAALFLASDDSRFVTGEALVVDGGLTALGPDLTHRMRLGGAATPAVGVNRGTTGQGTTVRYRLERDSQDV